MSIHEHIYIYIFQIHKHLPINNMIILIFNPPETLPKRPFKFPLNRVHFIPCNSLLPLKLWVAKTPLFRR
ncbi:hypothetical protein Hanom_Chr12g01076071 [Helianthus anomalus]